MIPKLLHFIWLGDESQRPDACIQSWVDQNPTWVIKLWDTSDISGFPWKNAGNMTRFLERDVTGIVDLMKWEILYNEGGFVIDADTFCLHPLPEWILDCEMAACSLNEMAFPGQLSIGYIGCAPENGFIGQLILDIENDPLIRYISKSKGVGAERFNSSLRKYNYADVTVLPSHFFIPRHPAAPPYTARGPVYAYKKWQAVLGHYDPSFDRNISPYLPGKSDIPPSDPLITIAMPVWNSASFIAEALQSAIAQRYANLEILIIDDGSTDNSADIIATFRDDRIRYIKQSNAGIARTRNNLLQEARGEYVLWLDSDDILMPDIVDDYARLAKIWPEVAVFYGGLLIFDGATGKLIEQTHHINHFGDSRMLSKLFMGNFLPNPGSMLRRQVALDLGGYDENLRSASDYDYWLRVAGASLPFMHVGKVACKYRWHTSNVSHKFDQLRESELYIVHKMIKSYEIHKLCADLDWRNINQAEQDACERVAQLLAKKGDENSAMLFRQHLAALKSGQFA